MKYLFIFCIKCYQNTISKILPQQCRFYPSCSTYMVEAITRYGIFKGIGLGLVRLSKCHPFHPGGIDELS